jgi:hypothetical protein
MSNLKIAALFILPFLPGCYIVVDDEPRRYNPPPPAETTVVVTPQEEEVNYVVYREYFGCSEQEIAYFPQYRRYYGLTDDDIYFIYFTSRQCSVSFDVCFHSYYYDCGRNYDRLVVYYRVPRERYFVAIGAGVSPPPMYARTYGSYRSGTTASVTFTNQEYIGLVHMKVGCEYQGHPPATYFARVQATGSSGRVIVESRDNCGRGGRTATGATVQASAPRPWKMPPQEQQQWHQERQTIATRHEATFKEEHKEQVTKVEAQQAQHPRTGPQGLDHKQGNTTPAPATAQHQGQGQADPNKPGPQGPAEPNRSPGSKGFEQHGQKPGQAEASPPAKGPGQKPPPQEKPKETEKPKGGEKDDKKDKDKK